MRRLIECRLVTDHFRDSQLAVHNIRVKADVEWREPFVSRMASEFFNNYDMKARYPERRTPKMISDRILHASVVGVLSGSAHLPGGLLIASDTQRRTELFYFTSEEIAAVIDASWMIVSCMPQTDISTTECSERTRWSLPGRDIQRSSPCTLHALGYMRPHSKAAPTIIRVRNRRCRYT